VFPRYLSRHFLCQLIDFPELPRPGRRIQERTQIEPEERSVRREERRERERRERERREREREEYVCQSVTHKKE
jgi:hypothetical protein